ncbi:AfsR/SARP family transcriptional regulator [Streptomyces shenzhenensis]|uniref:AfsR/SARP family transcriptional regulator n=1 Tax=Streptomyces shenzhenensis TaxID=943815 RepID=UPI00340BA184
MSVLGPLALHHAGIETKVASPKQRAIFAALLLSSGRKLSTGKLVEALWGDGPPRTASETVRTHVYLLRKALKTTGIGLPRTPDRAYALSVDDDVVDLEEFRRCVARAQAERLSGHPRKAASLYEAGLRLWRGEPLAGIPGPFADSRRRWLTESRLAAQSALLRCRMALGAHHEVAADLFELTAENPLDEGLRDLLMTCLYRANRQADALAVFRETRELLREQLGVEPSPSLCLTQRRILDRDETLLWPEENEAAPSAEGPTTRPTRTGFSPPQPAQLPKAPVVTGRVGTISRLVDAVREGVAVLVVEGMPGVGKTTLALHCAHRLAPGFPDGQLFLDLGGPGSSGPPMTVMEALKRLLAGVGVPAAALPAEADERASLFRSLLAGRRYLVLLENARDTEQIRMLLPGAASSVVLVTSRVQATGLVVTHNVRRVVLAEFTPTEARAFLAERLAGRGRPAVRPVLDAIADRCGRLPLALAVVAAQAGDGTDRPLDAVARGLDDTHGSLDAFRIGRDAATDLRGAFAGSYEALSGRAAQLFRLFAGFRGVEVTLADVAGRLGMSALHTDAVVQELKGASLLAEATPGRYRMHPLLCDYAAELAGANDVRSGTGVGALDGRSAADSTR